MVRYAASSYSPTGAALPIAARRERLQDFPNNAVPSHWHDDVEFVAVRRENMIYNVNGHTVPMTRCEGIFVNSRQLHFANSAAGTVCDCDYICIRMHPSLLCISDVIAMFDVRESSAQCSTAPMKALSYAATLWALLFENLPRDENSADIQDRDLAAVRNMMGHIQQNYADEMSLADIASAGAVGISKCCKLFAKYFEQSPISYLNNHRLSKAAGLLSGTDKSMTEIALQAGFGGASYFAESFKKWTGKTPTEFRKKLPL